MTVFQLNRGSAATTGKAWAQPTHVVNRPGRHATELRAKLTFRRMFYLARHVAR
ncbi:MAG TPA: hypothetical protein VGH11_14275 [Jatrophihabitans sp.]|jgi:hypothetical protein